MLLLLAGTASRHPVNKATQHPCRAIREALIHDGLFHTPAAVLAGERSAHAESSAGWRIATQPFIVSPEQVTFFQSLGQTLLEFYRALNRLYIESVRGNAPDWVATYLDQGKPEWLVSYARMKRFRDALPGVIRPDIILTEQGMTITELDAVPGGIGLTGGLSQAYAKFGPAGFDLVGGPAGMIQGFAGMLRREVGDRSGCVAIVVSEESRDYWSEMAWVAGRLREAGLETYCVEPREIRFTEESLTLTHAGKDVPIGLVYRFFELFDLKNVPKSELIMYSAKKDLVTVTPPFKPPMEEKLAFGLLHHPMLKLFWRRALGEEACANLLSLTPHTWILDPRPIPPSAVIPHLRLGGLPVNDWGDLAGAGQKDRRYVVKPSGFSELAWGSRGVSIGHDLPQKDWAATLERALSSFWTTPHVLQEFHKGRQVTLSYHDPQSDALIPMSGRTRLSPYYFVTEHGAELAGILATVCSLDKKLIHGMRDAIMVPCATAQKAA